MRTGVMALMDSQGANYTKAFPAFKSSYELSGKLNPLQNAALSAMKTERYGWAIAAYELLLERQRGKLERVMMQQMERDLRALKSSVVWVTLSSTTGSTKIVDRRIPRRGPAVELRYILGDDCKTLIGMHPGHHEITAHAPNKTPQVWRPELRSGQRVSHEFELARAEP